jgi:methylenetetrahydrofolate dehydrogenase (NADP+)/methenyltetrahydrofolate cyclohydrolase
MSAQILDGLLLSQKIKSDLRQRIEALAESQKPTPGLAVILVGADSASEIYVQHKQRACAEIGILSHLYRLATDTSMAELCDLIEALNQKPDVHGILLQVPLAAHLDADALLERIAPHKDVDGFHPYNLGRLAQRRPLLRPCTPYGMLQLLNAYQINVRGKHAVVVGASNIVGRPMALELLLKKATVTVCHRFTENLAEHVQRADILIAACGKPGVIQSEWIKPGAVILDAGITRLADGRVTGDIDFDSARSRASYITPVPGGVGPMTVATLMQNTLLAYELQ